MSTVAVLAGVRSVMRLTNGPLPLPSRSWPRSAFAGTRTKYQAIDERQTAWVNQLAAGLSHSELDTTARMLGELCTRLEAGAPSSSPPERSRR